MKPKFKVVTKNFLFLNLGRLKTASLHLTLKLIFIYFGFMHCISQQLFLKLRMWAVVVDGIETLYTVRPCSSRGWHTGWVSTGWFLIRFSLILWYLQSLAPDILALAKDGASLNFLSYVVLKGKPFRGREMFLIPLHLPHQSVLSLCLFDVWEASLEAHFMSPVKRVSFL